MNDVNTRFQFLDWKRLPPASLSIVQVTRLLKKKREKIIQNPQLLKVRIFLNKVKQRYC